MIRQFIDLHFVGGGSDKVYHCAIEEVQGGYLIPFAYGRHGSTLSRGFKTTSPVSLEKAEKIYRKLIEEKVSKGYAPSPGISGQVFAGATHTVGETTSFSTIVPSQKERSGFFPQLLNECNEEDVFRMIEDPDWGMQEKKNGERRMVKSDGAGDIVFSNRKGFVIPETPRIASAVKAIGEQILPDGEQIGDTLFVFGLLEYKGKNLRKKEYGEVFDILSKALDGQTGNGLEIVPLARTTVEKRALWERVKREKGEGVVFKRLDSVFMENRPASGGDQLKFKFWESASCVVLRVNDKRSVQIGVFDGEGNQINIGNVTIPANRDIPKAGDVVEVRYLYAYKGGSLYQPQFEGPRGDMSLEDCVSAQLKYCNEEECAVFAAPGR